MALTSNPARPFGALLTAMVTPLTADGAVDLEAARALATWLVDHGNDGLVLNGTTGEAPTTHSPEKADLVAAVVDAVGDRATVVAGAGSNDTAHAARMAQQAAEAGADGILIVAPYYSRPSQEGIALHVEAVAEAGGKPVMLYDVPGRAGVRISAGVYERLAGHPLVVATKDATGDVAAAAGLAASTGLAWYSGDDALLLPFLAHGGAGLVSVAAHATPDAFATAIAAWDKGDTAAALAAFRTTLPAIAALNGAGFQAVMAKAAVEALGIVTGRSVRLPLVEASDAEAAAVRAGLVAAGVLASA
ncbi:MAG: 4-hydroxy-tetrahydrodipicolinate synthase [Promicromonosporaceae bacterium]|nr:4-hydroxy-tetrahydrodipicolinate synthase [Promicromonosporaceae bacterium]